LTRAGPASLLAKLLNGWSMLFSTSSAAEPTGQAPLTVMEAHSAVVTVIVASRARPTVLALSARQMRSTGETVIQRISVSTGLAKRARHTELEALRAGLTRLAVALARTRQSQRRSARADGAGPTDGDGSAQRRGDGDRCALRRADGVSAQRRADEEHRGDGDTADQREHRAGKASRAYRAGSAPRRTDEVSRGAGEDSAEPAPKRSKDTHAGRSDEAGGAGHQRGAAGGAEPSASHSAPKRSKRAKSPQAGPGSGSDDDPSSARRGKRRARRQSDSEFSDSGDSTDTSQQAGSAVRTAKFLITDRLRPQSTSRRDTLIAFFAAASQLVLDLGGLDERVLRRLKDRQQAVDEAFLERFEVALGRISATLGCLWIPRAPPSNITRVGAIREEVVKLMYEASLEKVRPKGRSRRHHSSSDSEADGSPHRRGAPSRESREARELGMKDRLKALHLELASSLRAADAVAQIDALADEAVVFGLSALPEHFRKDIQRVALSNRRVYASGASRNAQQLPHSVLKIADATEGCIRTALE